MRVIDCMRHHHKKHTLTDVQRANIYIRMFQRSTSEYYKTQDRWALTKAVYNGVRLLNIHYHQLVEAEFVLMSLMTPEEIIRTFPITKTYDGERWQSADYFSSLNLFADISMNISLLIQQKEPFDILFGYQNPHISMLLVGMMGTVDNLRRADGKQFTMDENGKTFKVHKPKPRYLRLVSKGRLYDCVDKKGRR